MPGVPRTPASEPEALRALIIIWVVAQMISTCHPRHSWPAVHHRTLAFEQPGRHYAVRSGYATWFFDVQHSRSFSFRREGSSTTATPQQLVRSFAAISIGSGIGMGAGTSAASGGTCGEVVVPGIASQGVVQKSATGAVLLVPNQAMMSHIIFFPAGLDQRAHTTTSRHLHWYHFHLLPQSESLPPDQSRAHSQQATAPAPWPPCTATAPDFTVTATTDRRWTLVCVRRQDGGRIVDMSVALHRSLSIWIYGYACTLGYSDRCKRFKKCKGQSSSNKRGAWTELLRSLVLSKFHCHGRLSTSSCRTGQFRTDFRIFRRSGNIRVISR